MYNWLVSIKVDYKGKSDYLSAQFVVEAPNMTKAVRAAETKVKHDWECNTRITDISCIGIVR